MNGVKVFVDTNVLVYAYEASAGSKHDVAKNLMIELWNKGGALLSIQVLQEFYVSVTRKISHPISPASAKEIVKDLLTWDVVVMDGPSVLKATELEQDDHISFWDALIVAAAQKAGATEILSEDFTHGRDFAGVTIRDPFPPTPRA